MVQIALKAKALHPGTSVVFLGDFNRSVTDILNDPVCTSMGASPHTTPKQKSYSAGANGDNPENIDLMFEM